MECPQCGVQIHGKSLTRNSSYSTMVQCITKIRNLLNGTPTTQPTSKEQADVLTAVLDGIVGGDENEMENLEDNHVIEENRKIEMIEVPKNVKEPKPKNLESKAKSKKSDDAVKVKKPESKKLITKQITESKPVKLIKKFGLLLTGLSEDQKLTIQSSLPQLSKISDKAPFKVVKDYSPETVTHIICACAPKSHCPRTLKYLLGIAGKAWIVSFDWILESLVAGKILDEQMFVVIGDEAVQCDTDACEKSRGDPGKLFEERKFYLAGLFNAPGPSKVELTNLIQTAGGTVCKKIEDGAFIVSNNSNGPKEGELPYTWLFDVISLYKMELSNLQH